MRKVQIIITRREFKISNIRSWLSAIIRWRYGSWSNHAGIMFEEEGRKFIIDADHPGGVRILPMENWVHNDSEHRTIEVEVDFDKLISKVGLSKYDFRSLFRHLTGS